jgi:SSS family solute:Na+ symporter
MSGIEWGFVAFALALEVGIAILASQYMKSVADFMACGRSAGRYLLCVARSEMGAGAAAVVATFEMVANSGFVMTWWGWLTIPVGLVVAISGFVIYRFRETRALTLAQFFEIRYSKGFRVFCGVLGFLAGVLNFGIIPAIGARFFVYFMGLPSTLPFFSATIPTYVPVMGVAIGVTAFVILAGGHVAAVLSDCVEGMLSQVFYLVVIFVLLHMFKWNQISEVLLARPAGESLMNPFDSMQLKDFNLWYVLMSASLWVYGTMAWQNASAYNAAASSAHESRMANILGRWRDIARATMITLLAICAVTFLHHADFASQAASVQGVLDQIPEAQIQTQMTVPVALSLCLPDWVKGVLCCIVLMGMISGDGNHLHSWGSMFVQDILVPLRREPFTPEQHIRALRVGVAGVALFAFLFGALFRQIEYIVMWFQVTTAIFVGGAGAAIIGGLYWRKGTVAGAWAAMLTGAALSTSGILVKQFVEGFPFNGLQISFASTLVAVAAYVVVSLKTCKRDFELNRMLHRDVGSPVASDVEMKPRVRLSLASLVGIDSDFTRGDKWIAGSVFFWSALWFAVFVVGTVWNLIRPWSASVWSVFWHIVAIVLPVFIGVVTTVWFTWGALRDVKKFFRSLRSAHRDTHDDGTVVDHHNLDEVAE